MPGRALAPITLILLVGLFACFICAKPASALPSGFSDSKVADVFQPTALAFTPDGHMLVTTKPGQLHVFDQSGNPLASPALNLGPRVCDNSERGLLGVAVDPRFEEEGHNYVYLYYTAKDDSTCHNRVSRFKMNGNTVDESTEEVLIDKIHSTNGNHNGGDLKFGKDEKLYVSVGDGGCDYAARTRCQYENGASRDRHVLLGKILRINPDGTIPTDNPYYENPDSARCNVTGRTDPGKICQETYLMGFRNPFRFAIDPDATGTVLRINDVGGQKREEIDQAKVGTEDDGNDYGWNLCEGTLDNPYRGGRVKCSGSTYTGPIHQYLHRSGCESITGGAFVPDGLWPAEYDDAYLFGDYVCGKIFSLKPIDGGFSRQLFEGGLGGRSAVAMTFGPYGTGQALYYTTFNNGGEIRRVVYTGSNQAPVADVEATPPYGESSSDLTIDFDASGSSDPEGDSPLTYLWDFGDGATATTATPTTDHAYASAGKYTVTLTVRDSLDRVSDPARIDVFPGDTPPQPVIETPVESTTFRVGQEFTATGSATDEEGGPITLRWEVLRHHDGNHAHPYLNGTGQSATFTAPEPEGLYSTDPQLNYLEIQLTATDSLGLSKTVTRALRPDTVEVGFETQPSGRRLKVNGEAFGAPRTLVSWEGYALNVSAPRQKDRRGRTWVFVSWSDGGARDHTITTPQDPNTYTATFKRLRR